MESCAFALKADEPSMLVTTAEAIARAAAKNIKTEADLNEFRQMLTKITVETVLNVYLIG